MVSADIQEWFGVRKSSEEKEQTWGLETTAGVPGSYGNSQKTELYHEETQAQL